MPMLKCQKRKQIYDILEILWSAPTSALMGKLPLVNGLIYG